MNASLPSPPWFPWSFRLLHYGGWLGLALISFPFKLYLLRDWEAALIVTLVREGLGCFLSLGLREVYRRHWEGGERRLGRRAVLVAVCSLGLGALELLLVLQIDYFLFPFLTTQEEHYLPVSFAYRTFLFAIWSLLYFGIKEANAHRQKAEAVREAELRMLRSQINPHFFFNALNAIQAGIGKDPQALSALVQSLSDYLRYTLKHRDSLLVPLKEEYDAVVDYLAVEKARFRDGVEITTFLAPEASGQQVPGIILQPLLENAVKHGRATSPFPLRVDLRITLEADGRIVIRVANTGIWREGPPLHPAGGVGLTNLRERLRLTYPGVETLQIEQGEPGWVVVILHLPGGGAILSPPDAHSSH